MSSKWTLSLRLLGSGLALLLATLPALAGPIIPGCFGWCHCRQVRAPWYTYFPAPPGHHSLMDAPGPYFPNWPQSWPPTAPGFSLPPGPEPRPFPQLSRPLSGTLLQQTTYPQ